MALSAQGILQGVPSWLHFVGAFGPLAAFIVSGWTNGKAGLHELFDRMTRWRIGLRWILIAILSPIVLFMIAILILRMVTGSWPNLDPFGFIAEFPELGWIGGWILWTLTFGLGEEMGWRGFALPRLQRNYSARSASLMLGLLWAGWHIPVFFYNYDISPYGIIAFLIDILSGTAFLTWLYNSTGGSVLATILWHGAYNASVAGAQGEISAIVTAGIILLVIFIGNRYGPETLSYGEKHTLNI